MDATDTTVRLINNQPTTMHIIIENQPTEEITSRYINQPIPSIKKDQYQSKSSQIDASMSIQASTGFQTHNSLVTTYQITHCNVIPASVPATPTEYPVQSQTDSFRKSRMAQVADSFVQSLRKYPRALPEFGRSSEVIERLLSSTLAKRLSKSKKGNSKRNKKTKCHEVSGLRRLHLYPLRKKTACDCSKTKEEVALNVKATTSGMSSPKKQNTAFGLREMSRLQRLGGGAEVRYLNDVKKCIRDAIKHVWVNNDRVCPAIERRYLQHQKDYHSTNNDMASEPCCIGAKDLPNKGLIKNQTEPENNEEGCNLCSECNQCVPCGCRQPPVKDSSTNARLKVAKCCDQSTSLEDHMNTSSCCHLCKEEQEYSVQLFNQVIDWQQDIPLNADCSEEDKVKRQKIIKTLAKSLLRYKCMEDKEREEIQKALDIMPMWQPIDCIERNLFINNLIDTLVIRISLLKDDDNSLKTIVNDWIDKYFFKQKTLDKRVGRKDNIFNKFMVKIATMKMNDKSDKNEYNDAIRCQVNDLFKKLLVQNPDVNIVNKATDELVNELNNVLGKKSDTLNRKYGASYEVTKPETSKGPLDTDKNSENGNNVKITQNKIKDDIKKIIEITKSNKLDPRTESLLMEALIMKVKALTSSICSNSDFIKNTANNENMLDIIEMKVKQVVDQLPLAIANDMKGALKDEIVDVISKKMGSESSIKLPRSLKEEIRNYVKDVVVGILKDNAGDMRSQNKFQNDLTNLIADQIIRCDNSSNFKEKAYTLLGEANLSKSEMEDIYNSLLRRTIDMSLSLKHKSHLSSLFSRDGTSVKRTDQLDSKRTENEVVSFISHISSNLNSNVKEKLMISANHLAEKMEKIILDVKYSKKEKEEMLAKLMFNFFRNHSLPIDDSSKHRIIKWIKRLLRASIETSSPKQILTENYMSSPTLSSMHQDDKNFKTLSHGSLVQIYENPSLNIISHEVIKCIERIPSARMISHDKNYHKIVAKEIAQRLREAANQSSDPETALEQTVIRWLPKLVKKPNETELIWMTSILKKIMEDKELSEFSTRQGYQRQYMGQSPATPRSEFTNQCTEAFKNAIMNWLKDTSLYQNRNVHEKQFQENLVSDLALDLNRALSDTEKPFNCDSILKLLETRIKQFPMDAKDKCDKNYHRILALEIFKYLKDAQLLPSHKNSSLDEVTTHVLRWIDKIPRDRIISQDFKHQKAIAKEIAKRVIETKNQSQNPDLALECEVLRWLPKIVKEPTETELHGLKGNLKKIGNNSSNNAPPAETNQHIDALKYALMDWLKGSEMYHRRNKQEEFCQETVMANLAIDLDRINNNLPPNQNIDFERYILKTIESRLKELPLNTRVKNTENYNYTMAIDLLNYLKDLNMLRSIRKTPDETKKNVAFWIESLPLKWTISTHDARKTADRMYSMLSDYLDNDFGLAHSNLHFKSIVMNVLKDLPLREEFKKEEKLEILVEHLFIILKHNRKDREHNHGTKNTINIAYSSSNTTNLLSTELANKCAYIPIDSAQGPEDARKVREELVSGLVNIVKKEHFNYAWRNGDIFYETIIRNEVEQLLNTLKVNESCKRNLFSFKNYLVDVLKDVFKSKQKETFITNYRQQLYDIIENTLPTNTTLSLDQQTSFIDLKEKLVEAFVTLFKTTDMNTSQFKLTLRKEVHKFCNEYLRRYPATPLDTDKLCDNLFSVLQNACIPETKSPKYSDEMNYTKNKIRDYLEELPFKVTEENILLRNHFVNSIQHYLENPLEIQHINMRDKITEKLKQFTFLSEHKPNIAEITENIIKTLYKNNQMNKTQRQAMQQVPISLQNTNVRTVEKLDKQTSNINREIKDIPVEEGDNIIRDHFKESFREYIRYQQLNTGNKDVQVNKPGNDIENQINARPDLICEKNISDSPSCSELNCCPPKDTEICLDTLTCQKNIKTKCAQTEKACDLSPRIIVKEYYWDSKENEMVSSHQELQGIHNELRRTVPSLPFSKVDLPAPHCRVRRQYIKSPCISHISMADGNMANFPMNQPSVEEEIWASRKLPVTRCRQSNISLPRNIDRPEVLKPVTESKTKRQNLCKDQNRYGIFDDERRRSNDYGLTPESTERGSVPRPNLNPATDVDYSIAQARDEKKKCNCHGYVHQKVIGGPSNQRRPESNTVSHHSQRSSNINSCVKCRGGICLHPSYIYFN